MGRGPGRTRRGRRASRIPFSCRSQRSRRRSGRSGASSAWAALQHGQDRTGRKAGAISVDWPSWSVWVVAGASRSRRASAYRHQRKVLALSPSRRQKARTVSPLRCCCQMVHCQNFSRRGSRCLPPRWAMVGPPRYRWIGSRRSYHGHQDGVRKTHTDLLVSQGDFAGRALVPASGREDQRGSGGAREPNRLGQHDSVRAVCIRPGPGRLSRKLKGYFCSNLVGTLI
jgi:hypothetical protein